MNINHQINFYFANRQYTLVWQDLDQNILNEVVFFVLNDISSKNKLNNLTFTDSNLSPIQQSLALFLQSQHIFINNTPPITQVQECEFQNLYEILPNQLLIQKFKNKRKLESVNYQMQTILNLNQQFRETSSNIKDNNNMINQKQSIERSANTYPITKIQSSNTQPLNKRQTELKSYTIEEVKLPIIFKVQQHNTQKDAWIVLQDNIYDVSYYIEKHPGGREQILRGVGKDATFLFLQHHPWVNFHYILEKFQVGYLVR
ncbi:unnamed protein product (macronuclear) [Paramecium tetraurelia]|uniref:Cytochrome b5 heme-binding domain-containing protein n=1 Tax=Paramecium tetraurelia TaxID=5888 RepID=A0CED5_PARTE|nr:uncharacterized protein GSPATT00037589001 [Paramecium tetraurelia]CAK69152.1 unnamed protein product [Paramecium tetraurelia]|eukprot:XP_001436549.1 hypothetical protein (macronuclear) [Paramecium tetraurelia strain d4-2]